MTACNIEALKKTEWNWYFTNRDAGIHSLGAVTTVTVNLKCGDEHWFTNACMSGVMRIGHYRHTCIGKKNSIINILPF